MSNIGQKWKFGNPTIFPALNRCENPPPRAKRRAVIFSPIEALLRGVKLDNFIFGRENVTSKGVKNIL